MICDVEHNGHSAGRCLLQGLLKHEGVDLGGSGFSEIGSKPRLDPADDGFPPKDHDDVPLSVHDGNCKRYGRITAVYDDRRTGARMQLLARLGEITAKGLKFTYKDGPFEEEGILLKTGDGLFRAYKNLCRHLPMPLDDREPRNYWDPREFYLDPELGFLLGPSELGSSEPGTS